MMDLLHRFFWEDSRTRGTVYLLTVIAGIVYASVRTLAFHKPERQTAIQMVAFLFVSNFAAVFLYCVRGIKKEPKATQPLPHGFPLLIQLGGLAACAILVTAPTLSVSTAQAAIVNGRLERAASSIEPDKVANLRGNQLKARFQKISSIADASMRYGIPANPALVEKVQSNLQETLKSANPSEEARRSGVRAFVALVAFARYNNVRISVNTPTVLLSHGVTGNSMISQVPLKNGAIWWQGSAEGNTVFAMPTPNSEPVFPVSDSRVVFNAVNFNGFGLRRAFIGTDNESQVVVMNATVEGASQKLDSIVWLNVKFKSSEIIYAGGPLYLGDVSFENCRFQFGDDPESKRVLAQINEAQGEPVTLVSGL